jgi:hypothetical protein
MGARAAIVASVCLAGAAAISAPAAAQLRFADAAARDLVERSHRTIVENAASPDLRSLVLKGRLRIPRDDGSANDGLVELRIVLPDRYLRIDTIASSVRRSGFTGSDVLTPNGDLRRERAQFTRLMLGLAAWAPPGTPLVVKSTGETAFADTAAVDVDGPGFAARLVLDRATLVPLRIVYFAEGGVSTVTSFANRRAVDGFALPFRVTAQTPDRVLETLMFDEIVVNPALSDADFRR